MEQAVTYKEVIKFEHAQRGAYQDLNYEPTFRASAIFFAHVDNNVNTLVSFMNYWREKNHNPSVAALITLRNREGKKVHREFFNLEDFVYQVSVKDIILHQLDLPFIGSIEFEIFSSQDLKYSFPAIEVYYETEDGISFVHSNQRVFNNIEDEERNSSLNTVQTGFDIYANDDHSGYLTLINGPRSVPDSQASLKIFNKEGAVMNAEIPLGALPPYATRRILLKDVPSIRSFLKSEAGFCKLKIDLRGIFVRIACGNISNDGRRLSVTHSYYDCNEKHDYFEEAETSNNEYNCFLPFNLLDGYELDLVFYPIYSPSTLRFSLDAFLQDGRLQTRIENFASMSSAGTEMLRLDIRRLLEKYKISTESNRLYCLYLTEVGGKTPSRVTFGMNYHCGSLGSNISSSMQMNRGHGLRKRLYLWGPLMWRKSGKNYILLSHLSKVKDADEDAEISLKILAQCGSIFHKNYRTRNATALNLNLETLLSQSDYQPRDNEILWYVIESNCPNYVANQIHASPSGFVGADHSF